MKKKRRIKKKNVLILIMIMIFSVGLVFSIIDITRWILDSKKIEDQSNTLNDEANIEEVSDNENTEIIKQTEEIPEENPYWDYIKMNLIDVDFSELNKINSSTAGWIQVNGTNINYPFVKGEDNDYYLNHSFDKSYNDAGWVFLDYRNNKELSSKNNIIYAHGRYDNTMFGTLKNILNSGWLNNTDNYVVKMSTENENTLWQVFSVYKIETTSDYLQIDFNGDGDFYDFLNMLIKRSNYDFNTSINSSDKILTLSTCYNKKEKVVLHAKLIKKENKNEA